MSGSEIAIGVLPHEAIPAAARLLAESMRDNPLHQQVFATGAARLEPLLAAAFERLLRRQADSGLVLGAFQADALIGVAAMVPPGQCQPGFREKLAMLAILARAGALWRLPWILQWLRAWSRHDPDDAHWHLGPAAVDRGLQGQGIGSRLMEAICAQLDRHQRIGYLETDKARNVRLYRRGGFQVVAEQRVLGVTNWFMRREPGRQDGPVPAGPP